MYSALKSEDAEAVGLVFVHFNTVHTCCEHMGGQNWLHTSLHNSIIWLLTYNVLESKELHMSQVKNGLRVYWCTPLATSSLWLGGYVWAWRFGMKCWNDVMRLWWESGKLECTVQNAVNLKETDYAHEGLILTFKMSHVWFSNFEYGMSLWCCVRERAYFNPV